MQENYILAKWLNNDLTETELAEFKASFDFEKYEKIKNYTSQLKTPDFNEDALLEAVISHKKIVSKVVPLYKNWIFKVAAILILGLGISLVMRNFVPQTEYALNGKRTTFSLPDNSQVVLNSGSEIKFKKWNWDNNRNLQLDGEAYFRVAKGKKFEVTTNLGTVTVLGTQFDIKARKNRFDVTCFEGRVKVKYNEQIIVLTHGQSVSFINGKQINTILSISKPEWLQNRTAFYKENLQAILDEIQRQYDVSIEIKGNYPDDLFTGKIPTDNLDVALQIIATTYNLELKKIGTNKIIFERK